MYKIGLGYDLHRLVPGDGIIIAGVSIPFHKKFHAHSDGDVVFHALVDALLGALGLPDIGQTFADSDPTWKGANSKLFLDYALKQISSSNFRIANLDIVIIAQSPKLSIWYQEMKLSLATILKIDEQCIGIKAKTNERLDSIGRNEAIAAQVVVLISNEID